MKDKSFATSKAHWLSRQIVSLQHQLQRNLAEHVHLLEELEEATNKLAKISVEEESDGINCPGCNRQHTS